MSATIEYGDDRVECQFCGAINEVSTASEYDVKTGETYTYLLNDYLCCFDCGAELSLDYNNR